MAKKTEPTPVEKDSQQAVTEAPEVPQTPPVAEVPASPEAQPEQPKETSKPSTEELLKERASLQARLDIVNDEINRRKHELTDSVVGLRILRPRLYINGSCGGIQPGPGQEFRKASESMAFKSISEQGRAGTDFEFMTE